MALQSTKGLWPVTAAVGGNFLVTVIKFAAASVSGSSSMLSEAVHSFADTINQILLLIGLRRSTRKPDEAFEYGYGNERFFWALISACGVLFVGAGITGYSGINALSPSHTLEFSPLIFVVLIISLCLDSYTLYIAASSLQKDFPRAGWLERLARSDPSTLAVFLEDSVAVTGILVAFISIILAYVTGNDRWDAVGSLVISALLGLVAVILIIRNRSYLIGKSLPERIQTNIIEMLLAEPIVEKVIDFKSATVGFGTYRIKCEVEFNGSALLSEAHQVETLEAEFEETRNDKEAFLRFAADYADRIPRLLGRKIDEIEARIKKRYPGIHHIDIEVN